MDQRMNIDEKLMTSQDVCDFLRISKQALHEWVIDGKIKAYKLGHRTVRFRETDVLALFEEGGPENA
jgi:excisionase family DNA binding protein